MAGGGDLKPLISRGEVTLSKQVSQSPTYFTGLLVKQEDGEEVLTLGPYMGSGHMGLFQSLKTKTSIQKILWAGEVLVEQRDGQIHLLEANVTSGFVFGEQNQRQMIAASITIENSYQALLEKLKNKGWNLDTAPKQVEFDSNREHLMPEMNALGKNLRHTIYTAFNNIIPHLELTSMGISLPEDDDKIKELRKEYLHILESGVQMALKTSGYSYSKAEISLLNQVLEVMAQEASQFWGWGGKKMSQQRATELHPVFVEAAQLFTQGPSEPYILWL